MIPGLVRNGFLGVLWRDREIVDILLRREVQARYRGTALGFVWTLLSPVLLLAVYTVVFSVYMRLPIDDYPAFLFSAFIPWLAFATALQEGPQSLLAGASMVARSRLHAELLPSVVVLSSLVHCVFSLPFVIVIALLSGRPLGASLLALPFLLLLQMLLTLGPAIVLAALNVYLRDVQQVIPPMLQAWFFASPILYPASLVPESVWFLVVINPWAYLAEAYQQVLYHGAWPALPNFAVLAALGVAACLGGEAVFRSFRDRLAEEL